MKKKVILLLLLTIISPSIFSIDLLNNLFNGDARQEHSDGMYYGSTSTYYFDSDAYEFWDSYDSLYADISVIPDKYFDDDLGYIENGSYSIRSVNKFNYIEFNSNTDFTLKKKLGVLFHPRCLALYDKDQLFFMSNDGLRYDGLGPTVISVYSSSYLVEGETKYKGINIKRPFLEKLKPWVEGVSGYGIGEWIEISTRSPSLPVSFFLISNGFVSFEKPYLYDSNSRVKRLRITSEELGIDFEVELEDTPDFQEIRLPKTITEKVASFRFTIQEVYEGTKWDDTCINLIIPFADTP